MQYNICGHCGACNGRAGLLINDLCQNCFETKKTGAIVIYTHLKRTDEELQKTFTILNP